MGGYGLHWNSPLLQNKFHLQLVWLLHGGSKGAPVFEVLPELQDLPATPSPTQLQGLEGRLLSWLLMGPGVVLVFSSHKTRSVLKARTDCLFIPVSLSLDSWRLPSASSLAHSKCVQEDWSAGLPFWKSLQMNTLEIVLVSRRWVVL